jgi:hypothetical protein
MKESDFMQSSKLTSIKKEKSSKMMELKKKLDYLVNKNKGMLDKNGLL